MVDLLLVAVILRKNLALGIIMLMVHKLVCSHSLVPRPSVTKKAVREGLGTRLMQPCV